MNKLKIKHQKIKTDPPIAIIGMGCFFPKSSGLNEYWRLITHGRNGITDIPETHWSTDEYYNPDPKKEDHVYCKRGGFISPVMFDPTEFGIPPNTLESTDTSQLLGLMAAKAALDDSGYGSDKSFDRERTSVILGVTGTQELVIPLSTRLGHPKWRRALLSSGISSETTEKVVQKISNSYVKWQENSFPGLLGNVVAGRISNRLDLGGTNCVVDAACASSLGAIHLALLELHTRQSDMVITGGIDTLNDIFMHMCFSKTYVLSPTGDARPFSRDADGTVLGEGIGLLVLKRLADAKKDKDKIYAVIRGMGSSSDGKSQSIYAPRADGQAKALKTAYKKAGIHPSTIELIEAHGTGTKVGDFVEFTALKNTFKNENNPDRKCALGSVKSMIGHTKAAAGSAGLIKTALSLYHKVLPPTIKADVPDPKLEIQDSPFYLNTKTRPWFTRNKHPRRSGVSAFGFGGSNFHVVLEEYQPKKNQVAWDGSIEIFATSSDTHQDLCQNLIDMAEYFKTEPCYHQIAVKADESRHNFSHEHPHRFLVILNHVRQKPRQLADYFHKALTSLRKVKNQSHTHHIHMDHFFYGNQVDPKKLAFVFPGQGSQYPDMGRNLMCTFPEAFQSLDKGNYIFSSEKNLSDYIYPIPDQDPEKFKIQSEKLRNTRVAQPALGAVCLGMLKVLQRFGVKPDAACGHSFGELLALHTAGCFNEDTLLKLATARGKIMGSLSATGSMLAVMAPLDTIEGLMESKKIDLTLANRNSPGQGVLSGTEQQITRAQRILNQNGIKTMTIPVSAAFHSPLVNDAKEPFMSILKNIRFKPFTIPVYSNTTGRPYPKDRKKILSLLSNHILNPVDFISDIENLYNDHVRTFIEIGPKTVMSGLIGHILKGQDHQTISMDASSGRRLGMEDLAVALCRLASLGYPVHLNKWENTGTMQRKQGMSIPLTGTNYKVPMIKEKEKKHGSIRSHEKKNQNRMTDHPRNMNHDRVIPESSPKTEKPVPQKSMNNGSKKDMKPYNQNPKNKNQDLIAHALNTVQEGLKSIQTLQQQTAETHQKFLESQQEAGRTLQAMMESTQRLAEATLGAPLKSGPMDPVYSQPRINNPADHTDHTNSPLIDESENNRQTRPETGIEPPVNQAADPIDPLNKKSFSNSSINPFNPMPQDLDKILLEIVSELTGYPIEMLGMDMDIEADLGIDSIKRVEILSAMDERVPKLPPISPDVMGSMKTLGQIVEYILNQSGTDKDKSQIISQAPGSSHGTDQKWISQDTPLVKPNEAERVLLETVSHLTGYPVEMLGLDMDIEADLGIDSIKRVEILSLLEEKNHNMPSISPDVMGSLKTLGQIVDYLGTKKEKDTHATALPEPSQESESPPFEENRSNVVQLKDHGHPSDLPDRQVLSVVNRLYRPGPAVKISQGRKIFIVDDQSGLSKVLADELEQLNIHSVIISSDILKYKEEFPQAAGLIIVQDPDIQPTRSDIKDLFLLSQRFGPHLIDAAKDGDAIFASISRLDGAFGIHGEKLNSPMQGALAGLIKTAAIEWDGVTCRALDINPAWKDNQGIARSVIPEIINPDLSGALEVGLSVRKRVIPELKHAPYAPYDSKQTAGLSLSPGDVTLITGGARGITAAAASALAKKTKSTMILMGRSPSPSPEPKWLLSLETEQDIKKAIYENEFNNVPASPKEVEYSYTKHMANRIINSTLEKIKRTGTPVHYYSVDVCDSKKVDGIVSEILEKYGPIKALIHGAGVLEDRLIIDKTPEQFEKVFDTKVAGLKSMLAAIENQHLRYLVLFSSVAARLGNQGQSDYAMANEAMNKMAAYESIKRPDCKVVAINWGPWDGGMVSDSLKREFKRKNIPLIPVKQGAQCMLNEMAEMNTQDIEVVIGGLITPSSEKDERQAIKAQKNLNGEPSSRLSLSFQRELNVENYPILRSHMLNGKPVVPLALMNEWFGHGALHENPGLLLQGLDDMRILNGIKLDHDKKSIRLLSGKAKKQGNLYEVDIELRDGIQENQEIIHTRAKAILTDQFEKAPKFKIPENMLSNGYQKSVKNVYEEILFHGAGLHGLKKIDHLSPKGMVAHISPAPAPEKWIKDPLRNKWIGDPLIMDCAFQMATIWCHEEMGAVSLPSYYASYRQYRSDFPENGVKVILIIGESDNHKMSGDFTFLDSNEDVVARLTGYQAIMNSSLMKAFKPQRAVNE